MYLQYFGRAIGNNLLKLIVHLRKKKSLYALILCCNVFSMHAAVSVRSVLVYT